MTYMVTYSGKKFNPLKPTRAMINIVDISHALSMQARFCGQLKEFYSVAEHCVMVADILEDTLNKPELAIYGLLHDGHEAFISDIPSPIKALLQPAVGEVEDRIDKAIWSRFELKPPNKEEKAIIKQADIIAFLIEDKVLRGGLTDTENFNQDLVEIAYQLINNGLTINPSGFKDAKIQYMEKFVLLTS